MKIMHLEDMAFTDSKADIQDMMGALIYSVNGGSAGHLSLKYDGTCLVFGRDIENRFFISDQGYFNKTPRKFYDAAEILEHKMDEDKRQKLLLAYQWLSFEKIRPGMVYYSDWLFDSRTISTDRRSFQPNILHYTIKNKFSQGLGLAVHTQEYCGVIMPSNRTFDRFIYCAETSMDGFDPMEGYQALFDDLGKIESPWFRNKDATKELRSYMNKLVKENDHYDRSQLVYFTSQMEDNVARNLEVLIPFKYKLLDYLNLMMEQTNLFELSIDGKPANHEGFVFQYKNRFIKLVDRYKFSKKNFDRNVSRGWQVNGTVNA